MIILTTIGGGVYIPRYWRELSFRLQDGSSLIQAEVAAVWKAADWRRYNGIGEVHIRNCIDSKAAIKALSGIHTKSSLIRDCRRALNEVAELVDLELCWIHGHDDVPGNLIADWLARSVARMRREEAGEVVGIPMAGYKEVIRNALLAVARL